MEHAAVDDPKVLIQVHPIGSTGRQIAREAQVSELVEVGARIFRAVFVQDSAL